MFGKEETADEPICDVCGKRIRKGEGRFRPGTASVHVECYEMWKEKRRKA